MKKLIIPCLLIVSLFAENNNAILNLKNAVIEKSPKILCQKNQLYVECYDIDQKGCTTMMNILVKACWKQYENKMILAKSINERAEIGNQIGKCTGLVYTTSMKIAKKENAQCLQQSKWKKQLAKQKEVSKDYYDKANKSQK